MDEKGSISQFRPDQDKYGKGDFFFHFFFFWISNFSSKRDYVMIDNQEGAVMDTQAFTEINKEEKKNSKNSRS